MKTSALYCLLIAVNAISYIRTGEPFSLFTVSVLCGILFVDVAIRIMMRR